MDAVKRVAAIAGLMLTLMAGAALAISAPHALDAGLRILLPLIALSLLTSPLLQRQKKSSVGNLALTRMQSKR